MLGFILVYFFLVSKVILWRIRLTNAADEKPLVLHILSLSLSLSVRVALLIQRAMRMRRIIL